MDYGEPTSVSTPCIEWNGYKDKNGYGVKRWNGKNRKVHRIAWEEAYGPIPFGIKICHKCDNPSCYRLDHLFSGTQRQNVLDMFAKGRGNRRKGANPKAIRKGEDNGRAKINWDAVRIIRAENQNNPVIRSRCGYYARLYGVSTDTIRRIVKNKNWRE